MTVTFAFSDGNNMYVPGVDSSDLIKDVMLYFGTADVTVDVPDKYVPVFGIYLTFLTGSNVNLNINKIATLLQCFDMESYFIDNKFFEHLMTQAYTMWFEFYPVIGQLPNEQMAYLYTPYEFLPQTYIDNPTFMNQWLGLNQNKQIVIDNNGEYKTIVTYYENATNMVNIQNKQVNTMIAYHEVNGNKVGHGIKQQWYYNGNLNYINNYFNDKLNGALTTWYVNGQLAIQACYINNVKSGLQIAWYANGNIKHKKHYVDGKEEGEQESWYENGQPEHKGTIFKGGKQGQSIGWYENGKPAYKNNYDDDYEDGMQQVWYESEGDEPSQLEYIHNFVNKKTHGVQIGWYQSGELQYKSLYNMGYVVRNLLLNQ